MHFKCTCKAYVSIVLSWKWSLSKSLRRFNFGKKVDRVVWSSGWGQSWKGLLSVTVTDVSTTWAEVIIRVCLLTLMMTSAQVVETSVTVTDNSPFQDYPHPDDHTTRSTVTPGFKPFTVFGMKIAHAMSRDRWTSSIKRVGVMNNMRDFCRG